MASRSANLSKTMDDSQAANPVSVGNARRRNGRRRRKTAGSSRLWKWLGLSSLVCLLAALGVFLYVKSYLGGEAFRKKIAALLEERLQARVDLPKLTWGDQRVQIPLLTATGKPGAAFQELRVDDISSQVELKILAPELPIPRTDVSRLRLVLPGPPIVDADGSRPLLRAKGQTAPKADKSSWGSFSEKKPKFGSLSIQSMEALYRSEDFSLRIHQLPLQLQRGQSDSQWSLSSHPVSGKATLECSLLERVRGEITDLEARVEPGRLDLSQLAGHFIAKNTKQATEFSPSQFSAQGYLDEALGSLEVSGKLENGRLEDWLDEDWIKRISGRADVRFTYRGSREDALGPRLEGRLESKQALVQGLPLLIALADRTRTQEFLQLSLNALEADFTHQAGTWTVRQILIESRGLVKVEGSLRLTGNQIQGVLEVGVVPGRLKAIDGAEQKVFIRESDGYKWASPPLRLWGTLGNIQEDLSQRIRDAWFEQQIDTALDLATQTPTKAVEKGVEAGTLLLEKAPDVIETGVRIFEGLLPK